MRDMALEQSLQDGCKAQERLLTERRNALGDDHPDTLAAMLELADCLWAQGRLIAARKLEERVVEERRQQLGEQHPDTLKAIGKLAVTLAAQGNLAEARRLQEQVVDGRRSLSGETDLETMRAINNLAGTGGNTSYATNFATVQEVAVETGGASAESEANNVRVNLVP